MEEQEDLGPLLDGVHDLPDGSLSPVEVPPGLEGAVRGRPVAVVRWRRRRRHLRNIALLGLVYLAGLASADLLESPARNPPGTDVTHEPHEPVSTQPDETSNPSEMLRRVRGNPPAEQRRLLKLAGDTYLGSHADVENALYCYRQLLELTPRAERALPAADDSWLLVALKQDQSNPEWR